MPAYEIMKMIVAVYLKYRKYLVLIFMTSCLVRHILADTTTSPSMTSSPFSNRTVNVTLVLLEPSDTSWPFARPKVQPVMDYAVEILNQKHQGVIRFRTVSREGSCDMKVVGVAAARVSCRYNISVFIGPACSRAVEIIGYMANDWNVPIITPVGNTENIGDKTVYPRLTRINPLMQSSVVDMVFYLLRMYKWRHIVFFYDIDETMGDLFGVTFSKMFKSTTDFIWTGYELNGRSNTREVYRSLLKDAGTRSRIFLMCVAGTVLKEFMLEAHSLGFTTSGDFVFIEMISISTVATDANTWLLGNGTEEQQILKGSLGQMLFMHIDVSELTLPPDFASEMRRRSLASYGYNYSNDEVSQVDTTDDQWLDVWRGGV